jgi:hypothetical protein
MDENKRRALTRQHAWVLALATSPSLQSTSARGSYAVRQDHVHGVVGGLEKEKKHEHAVIHGNVQDAGCPSTLTKAAECSGAGKCENGVCYCTLGYSGERESRVTSHESQVASHCHKSRVTSHKSRVTSHESRVTVTFLSPVSRLVWLRGMQCIVRGLHRSLQVANIFMLASSILTCIQNESSVNTHVPRERGGRITRTDVAMMWLCCVGVRW